jgi:hypothetical protein
MRTQVNINWDNMEKLKEAMGENGLLEELCRAMNAHEMKENLSWIAQSHGINLEGEEENE